MGQSNAICQLNGRIYKCSRYVCLYDKMMLFLITNFVLHLLIAFDLKFYSSLMALILHYTSFFLQLIFYLFFVHSCFQLKHQWHKMACHVLVCHQETTRTLTHMHDAVAYLIRSVQFLRATAYMLQRVYAIARPSVRLSVCLSVCRHTGGSVKNG